MARIGIADTCFARYDMGSLATRTIKEAEPEHELVRYTVPGFKDLPVACKKLLEEEGCEICLALGMAGSAPIDETCAHEASQGLIQAQLLTNKHVIVAFVHEREATDEEDLKKLCEERTRKHALNVLALLKGREALQPLAGKGKRQGRPDAGPLP